MLNTQINGCRKVGQFMSQWMALTWAHPWRGFWVVARILVPKMPGIWKFWGETGRILGTGSPSRDCRPPFLSPLIDRGTAPAGGHSLKWRATHRWHGAMHTHSCNVAALHERVFHTKEKAYWTHQINSEAECYKWQIGRKIFWIWVWCAAGWVAANWMSQILKRHSGQ